MGRAGDKPTSAGKDMADKLAEELSSDDLSNLAGKVVDADLAQAAAELMGSAGGKRTSAEADLVDKIAEAASGDLSNLSVKLVDTIDNQDHLDLVLKEELANPFGQPWSSSPETGAWARGEWGPGLWGCTTSNEEPLTFDDLVRREYFSTPSKHWSVTIAGKDMTKAKYCELKETQKRLAQKLGLESELIAIDSFFIPCQFRLEEVKDLYPDPDNVELCKWYDDFRSIVLPDLWVDINKPEEGVRSVEVNKMLSSIIQEAEEAYFRVVSKGEEPFLCPFEWWVKMDEERKRPTKRKFDCFS